MTWNVVVLMFCLCFPILTQSLECYSCVKVSPPCLCSKSCDKVHPPCSSPFEESHKTTCQDDESCVAVTQVHVGKVLNLFGCYNCEEMLREVPGVKCEKCTEDLCNTKAPTSCDMV